jgi:hypothetical protein
VGWVRFFLLEIISFGKFAVTAGCRGALQRRLAGGTMVGFVF